ncbi:selenoprotein Pa isoform 2-T2 [Acanthopagrus schlegelii]
MRVLRSQRSAHQKQMHSLTQMQSSLLKKTLDMVTIKDITILILGMAMGLAVITTMARTNTLVAMAKAMITTMAITLGIIVVMAVTIDKVSKMSDSKKYLKGKII